jgi:hypothetical protein
MHRRRVVQVLIEPAGDPEGDGAGTEGAGSEGAEVAPGGSLSS